MWERLTRDVVTVKLTLSPLGLMVLGGVLVWWIFF